MHTNFKCYDTIQYGVAALLHLYTTKLGNQSNVDCTSTTGGSPHPPKQFVIVSKISNKKKDSC